MKKSISLLLALGLLSYEFAFSAEQTVNEIWNCTLNDGATMEDVRTANSAWVSFVNSKLDGSPVSSATITAVVGDNSRFMIVDTYPNLRVWAEAKKALESEETQEVDDMLDEALSCSTNNLYESTPS